MASQRNKQQLNTGIIKLNKRRQELLEFQTNDPIDLNRLEPVVNHFVRNISEIFGEDSNEYKQYKNSNNHLHLGSWNVSWSKEKFESERQSQYKKAIARSISAID